MSLWKKFRPSEPGLYWIRTSEGDEAGLRTVYKDVNGSLQEAASHNWAGYWYHEPVIPPEFDVKDTQ